MKMSRLALPMLALFLTAATSQAQDSPAPSKTARVLSHFDVGLSGMGVFNKSVTGTVQKGPVGVQGTQVTTAGSNTFGALFTLRGTKSPWVGIEGNIGYARYTHTYSCCQLQGGVQANATEYTFGYVAHPRQTILGAHPVIAAGTGVMAFKPTNGGGQQLNTQARQTYYYSVGADIPTSADWFLIRVGFRQQFFKAPDFGQNYLTILKMTTSTEPTVGFVFHF